VNGDEHGKAGGIAVEPVDILVLLWRDALVALRCEQRHLRAEAGIMLRWCCSSDGTATPDSRRQELGCWPLVLALVVVLVCSWWWSRRWFWWWSRRWLSRFWFTRLVLVHGCCGDELKDSVAGTAVGVEEKGCCGDELKDSVAGAAVGVEEKVVVPVHLVVWHVAKSQAPSKAATHKETADR
jgi:hypothetical protein